MGLEIATYISGLTASWPTSGEPKSQGDDHLRLLKSVLQATFPIATGPMYFPKAESASTAQVLDVTDQNNIINISTASGDVNVTLPAGFDTTKAGWSCEIMKGSGDTNGVMVAAATGTITSRVGVTATIRVGAYAEPCRFFWTGSTWVAVKPGIMVGTSFNWDASWIPQGCLALNGTAFNSTTYAELFLMLGSSTLKDKRGRADIGNGIGTGLGGNYILGTLYGGETVALGLGNLPNHTHTATTVSGGGHTHTGAFSSTGTIGNVGPLVNSTFGYGSAPGSSYSTSSDGGHTHTLSTDALSGAASTAFSIVSPVIATQKLIRAC